ncbi:DUF339-domain-containing protein [Xylariaceae sp. FL0016]|nr:DUF339-domain-containing protein [Xylariaceae sp. FL0016]
MASLPRTMMRATRALAMRRPISATAAARATHSNMPMPPPMEPHKARGEMGVGELEGASFKVEPIRRVGEDDKTMRARLVYQSRKRGTLESDLLLSTFADVHLPSMTREQMAQYDAFLDENDWDIYYWATQEPPSSSSTTAGGSNPPSLQPSPAESTNNTSDATYGSGAEAALAESADDTSSTTTGGAPLGLGAASDAQEAKGSNAAAAAAAASSEPYRKPGEGEWAQTIGTFKPAYRPVPARWANSEVLRLLRQHVREQSEKRGGMAFMPSLRT